MLLRACSAYPFVVQMVKAGTVPNAPRQLLLRGCTLSETDVGVCVNDEQAQVDISDTVIRVRIQLHHTCVFACKPCDAANPAAGGGMYSMWLSAPALLTCSALQH